MSRGRGRARTQRDGSKVPDVQDLGPASSFDELRKLRVIVDIWTKLSERNRQLEDENARLWAELERVSPSTGGVRSWPVSGSE